MPVPATSGSFKTDLYSMSTGDYIACRYDTLTNAAGNFSNLGASLATAQATELSTVGAAAPGGYFYFLKANTGLLIADRNIQHSVSWNTIQSSKMLQGIYLPPSDITDQNYIIDSGHYETRNQAFNNVVAGGYNNCWESAGVNTGWVGQNFPSSRVVIGYAFYVYSDIGTAPKTWTFEASNDGNSWTVLDTRTVTNWIPLERREFFISNTTPYTRYRLNITSTTSPDYYIIIDDMEMFESKFSGKIRVLTGGVACANTNGTLSSSVTVGSGAWPTCNEWDTYIVKSTLGGKIIAGDDNVWHWNTDKASICQDIIAKGMTCTNGNTGDGIVRSMRGRCYYNNILYADKIDSLNGGGPTDNITCIGFRPVLEFLESDAKASNVWY